MSLEIEKIEHIFAFAFFIFLWQIMPSILVPFFVGLPFLTIRCFHSSYLFPLDTFTGFRLLALFHPISRCLRAISDGIELQALCAISSLETLSSLSDKNEFCKDISRAYFRKVCKNHHTTRETPFIFVAPSLVEKLDNF